MISYDTSTSGGSVNPGTSLSWSHTCSGSQRVLFVFYRGGNSEGDKVTGVTYNGVAMTKLSQTVTSPSTTLQTMGGYYLLNPSSGANNIVISLSSGYLEGVAASYKGVSQANMPDSINTGTAHATTSLTTSTTTVKKNCWTILGFNGESDMTASTGSTVRVANNRIGIFDSNTALSVGANSMRVTCNVADIGGLIVSFAPSNYAPMVFFT